MAVANTARSPSNGYVFPYSAETISIGGTWTPDGDTVITQVTTYYKVGSAGSWQSRTTSVPGGGETAAGVQVYLGEGQTCYWYQVCLWYMPGREYGGSTPSAQWTCTRAFDTNPPSIDVQSPAAAQAPAVNGILFQALISKPSRFERADLYIDSELEAQWDTVGLKSYYKPLSLGEHTYRWYAVDKSDNASDTGTVAFGVVNAAPYIPSGAISVPAQVANLGSVYVKWPAFPDGNPEDAVSYSFEAKHGEGEWSELASGLPGPEYYWTPNGGLGPAQVRVRAHDGTAYSDYLTSGTITVRSSQSPNDPTIGALADTPWREGEVRRVSWTPASPEHPEGLPVTYRVQFSAAGDFSDAVTIGELLTGAYYDWPIAPDMVTTDTSTCKVRVRAEDTYSKVSAWSTSGAFRLNDNAPPTVEIVGLENEGLITGNTPYFVLAVADDDNDPIHVELELSVRPDLAQPISSRSSDGEWEEASDPYLSWDTVPAGGATSGNRVRWQTPALRYDYYYLRARAHDGLLYSPWTPVLRLLVAPSGLAPLTCTIGNYPYDIEGLKVVEKTGGEPSPLEFTIPIGVFRERPIQQGAPVSIALSLGGESRVWNGTTETITSSGATVNIRCLLDDALMSRRLVAGDIAADDIGKNLMELVDTYGAPMDSGGMPDELGFEAAIEGDLRTVGAHLQEWAELLGLLLWVDETATVHLTAPDEMPVPKYIMTERYD